ncbi:MAG: DNA-directed RNA polymerase subunit K [Nitrososphaerales archaeon]|nr:DNA-directed RNA polymerase subunit K [Nitrososphaerales archaeon]
MTKQDFKVEIGPAHLTRFERAKIIGSRALQLSLGAPPFVKVSKSIHDPILIATLELDKTVMPLIIRRTYPDGTSQNIPLSSLM